MSIWFLVSCRRIWLKPTYANVMIIISHFTQGNFTYFEQIHQITIPGFFAHEIWNCKLGQLAQPVKPNQYFYVADNLRSGVASFLRAFAIYEKLSEGNTGGTKRRSRTGNMSGCLGRVQSDQAGPASPRFVALEERLGGSQVWGGQLRSPGWGMEIACWTSSAWPDLVLHCQPVWGGRGKTRWRHTPGQAWLVVGLARTDLRTVRCRPSVSEDLPLCYCHQLPSYQHSHSHQHHSSLWSSGLSWAELL